MNTTNIHTKNIDTDLLQHLARASLSLFARGIFGISLGSISARVSLDRFVINKKTAIFDQVSENSFTALYRSPDYRWNDATPEAHIHADIYDNFKEVKFIIIAQPQFFTAWSLRNSILKPQDVFGFNILGASVPILDPKDFESWYERADTEIVWFLRESKKEFALVRGYGAVACGRDLHGVINIIDAIESSARILCLSHRLDLNINSASKYDI